MKVQQPNIIYFLLISISSVIIVTGCSDSTSINNESSKTSSTSSIQSKAKTSALVQDSLFIDVQRQRSLTTKESTVLSYIKERPTATEIRIASLTNNISTILQKEGPIELNIVPDRSVVTIKEKIKQLNDGITYWRGTLQNQRGYVQFTASESGVTGYLKAPSDSLFYKFQPIGNGLHALIKLDPSKAIPDHSPDYPSGALIDTAKTRTSNMIKRKEMESSNISVLSPNPGPDIDVLAFYTTKAAPRANIDELVAQGAEETNISYANSNINANINIVDVQHIAYNEEYRSFTDHLNAMKNTSDGIMDNINSIRNQNLADVVVLVVDDTDGGTQCGQAYEILAQSTTAFAAVHYDCITGPFSYTFGHEIGHLQGAEHDDQNDSNNAPYQFGHGYVAPNNNWRTMMAYSGPCNGCLRIDYWSNPDITYYDGLAMGTEANEDNARVLDLTKYDVRDFRTLAPPSNFTHTNPNSTGDMPHFTWTEVPEANSHHVYRCITETGSYPSWCFQQVGGGTNNWTDQTVTMVDPYEYPYNGDCPATAIYYVTAQNRTGESSHYNQINVCVES